MSEVLEVIRDRKLGYADKRSALAGLAESSLPYVPLKKETAELFADGVLCDLGEGHAPWRPRYILPDYSRLIKEGSSWLELPPPRDLYEAVNALLIAYRHVPSITGYPVYIGDVDELLEPFVDSVSKSERSHLLEMYLVQVDRCLPDAFVHMNLGPRDTVTGREILDISKRLARAVPNISLRWAAETGREFGIIAASSALAVGKPYFVNHAALTEQIGPDYAVASCYNTLRRGGGAHTLVRLSLKKIAERSSSSVDFLENMLPAAVDALIDACNSRARFLVEESGFFESSFLAREGWISIDKFTSMAGVFGMYEAIEKLCDGALMGRDEIADELALEATALASKLVKQAAGEYCAGYGGKLGFHAQSGIDTDVGVTPGVRIRYGNEVPLHRQLSLEGSLHRFFDAGVSEITVFDRTAAANPEGLLRIVDGAHKAGVKIMSMIGSESELVRITGYLVKRSDAERYYRGESLREGTVALAAETIRNGHVLDRIARGAT